MVLDIPDETGRGPGTLEFRVKCWGPEVYGFGRFRFPFRPPSPCQHACGNRKAMDVHKGNNRKPYNGKP